MGRYQEWHNNANYRSLAKFFETLVLHVYIMCVVVLAQMAKLVLCTKCFALFKYLFWN